MAIFFNGALEPERFGEWRARQLHLRNNVRQVLKHVHKRATPPPKAWYVVQSRPRKAHAEGGA